MQVTAQITISCGCGFAAKTNKDAVEHAQKLGHTLTVHGVIKAEGWKPKEGTNAR